jgi:uncharacterized protein YdiU (UPF0061 family)
VTRYRPDTRLPASGLAVFDVVNAAAFPKTVLRYRNQRAAASVGLDGLSDADWLRHFGHFEPLANNLPEPLALRYHGHQFRQYNPDLGDGRGFLFAQLRDDDDRLLDLGTKGSGTTPWSRGGDGRLTLKGGVREVLATAMLEALGVPTSKSFSLIETGEALMRGDEPSPTRSSVLVRLSHSHIRFGTFERLAYLGDTETMQSLADYVIAQFYPDAANTVAMYAQVVAATARLTARWMAAGFVHGVLNTDNMNITGESFDYGPYRFLPYYDPMFTAAYFDRGGLYAYGRQADATAWNLSRLGSCLTLIADAEAVTAAFHTFNDHYRRELDLAVCARLNVAPKPDNSEFVRSIFALLESLKFDGSFEGLFYDWFGGRLSEDRAMNGPRAVHYVGDRFAAFHDLLMTHEAASPAKLAHPRFNEPDPETLLIDEIEAIWAHIADADDWAAFEAKLDRIEIYRQALSL